jgi:predicted nucleotidyltransferase
MSTPSVNNGLAATLFGKARRAILSLLYGHADEAFYLRQIVRATGIGLGPAQRELKMMTEAGIVIRERKGNLVYYRANSSSPIFNELKNIVRKTFGVADVVREALAPLAEQIAFAFVYGSMASGEATSTSDIDLLVIGDIDEMALHRAISQAENKLAKSVNYSLMSQLEFRKRRSDKGGFLDRILSGPKLMILGSIDEI